MSTISANDIQNTSGGIPTVKGQRLIPTAWVNFNGTGTVAIRDSENVSSITDISTGRYTVNFAASMSNADYVILIAARDNSYGNQLFYKAGADKLLSSCKTFSYSGDNTYEDNEDYSVAIMGGQ
jgi:hypothetical protein